MSAEPEPGPGKPRPGASLVALLLLATCCLALLFYLAVVTVPAAKAEIRRGHDEQTVEAVRRAPRALVCLTCRNSVPAKISERFLEEAARQIVRHPWGRQVKFFALEDG